MSEPTQMTPEQVDAFMKKWEEEQAAKAAGESPEAKKKKEKKDKIKEGVKALKEQKSRFDQLKALEEEGY